MRCARSIRGEMLCVVGTTCWPIRHNVLARIPLACALCCCFLLLCFGTAKCAVPRMHMCNLIIRSITGCICGCCCCCCCVKRATFYQSHSARTIASTTSAIKFYIFCLKWVRFSPIFNSASSHIQHAGTCARWLLYFRTEMYTLQWNAWNIALNTCDEEKKWNKIKLKETPLLCGFVYRPTMWISPSVCECKKIFLV